MMEASERVAIDQPLTSLFDHHVLLLGLALQVVVAAVRRPEALAELVAEYSGLIDPVALDVTDIAAIDNAVAGALDRHGRIDVLVNNAGRTQVGGSRRPRPRSCAHWSSCTCSGRPRSPARCCRTCGPVAAGRWS